MKGVERRSLFAICAVFLSAAFKMDQARAYDPTLTHPAMTESSVNSLTGSTSSYLEVWTHLVDLREGSTAEDGSGGSRGRYHFYDPNFSSGLGVFLGPVKAMSFTSALETAKPFWSSAITGYRDESLLSNSDSYFSIGRVLHLVCQDMAQPQHVHNDPHLPDIVGDDSPIDVPDWINDRVFPVGAMQPAGLNLRSPSDFGVAVSRITHDMSQFPGSLDADKGTGAIQLPGVTYHPAYKILPVLPDSLFNGTPYWEFVTPDGEAMRYFVLVIDDGDALTQSKYQDWWPVRGSPGYFYIDKSQSVTLPYPSRIPRNQDDERLDEYFVKNAPQTGIAYGAGLLKLFYDLVKPPPYIKDYSIYDKTANKEVYRYVVSPGADSDSREVKSDPLGSPSLRQGGSYAISVHYSESMNSAWMSIGDTDLGLMYSEELSDNSEIWSGDFTLPEGDAAPSCGGQVDMTAGGSDIFNHWMNGTVQSGIALDLHPETVARRDPDHIDDATYPWLGYETGSTFLTMPAPCACDPTTPDQTKPKITLSGPVKCSLTPQVTISGHASDNCRLQSITVNGQSVDVPDNTSSEDFQVTLTLPDGDRTVTAVATDASGNSESTNIQFKQDTVGPELTSNTPPDGATDVLSNAAIRGVWNKTLSDGKIEMGGQPLTGTSVRSDNSIDYQHNGLQLDSTYLVSATDLKDECGVPGPDAFWSFTTAPFDTDLTKPTDTDDPKWSPDKGADVNGYVKNPQSSAQVHLCVDIPGVPCNDQMVPPGASNVFSHHFDFPDCFEGPVTFTADVTYNNHTVRRTRHGKFDSCPPTIALNPPDGTAVNNEQIDVTASAEDKHNGQAGSGIRTLVVAGLSASFDPPGVAESLTAKKGLHLGPNFVEATAVDAAGNTAIATATITRSGGVTMDLADDGHRPACGPGVNWKATVNGAPGLLARIVMTGPLGAPIREETVLGNAPWQPTFRGNYVGDYRWDFTATVPATGELVGSDTKHDGIGQCRGDPTFVEDSGIFPSDGSDHPSIDTFSPGTSPGSDDVFTKQYAALYPNTDATLLVRDAAGRTVRTLSSGTVSGGFHDLSWDGRDDSGALLPEGVYGVHVEQSDAQNAGARQFGETPVEIDETSPTVRLDRIEGSGISPRVFTVWGEASDRNLDHIRLLRRQGGTETEIFQSASLNGGPVADDKPLATIDATAWPAGNYIIRLAADDRAGNSAGTARPDIPADDGLPASLTLTLSDGGRALPHLAAALGDQSALNVGGDSAPPDSPDVFGDDDVPAGAEALGNWSWSPIAYSGSRSHTTGPTGPLSPSENRLHYFIHADPGLAVAAGQNLVQYVYLDRNVRAIALQFYVGQGDGEHRVFWGDDTIQMGGVPGTSGWVHAGPLPPPNRWVRLRVPAETIGVAGQIIRGMAFASDAGTALWDKTTESNGAMDPGGLGYTVAPAGAGDDSTATELSYSLDRASDLRVTVVDPADGTVKSLLSGTAGDPLCCTEGEHRVTWDETNDAGAAATDGDYAFRLSNPSGALDTEVFARDPGFDSDRDAHPNPAATSAADADGNTFAIDASSPSVVVKKNANGLFLARVLDHGSPLTGLALDASGHLFVAAAGGPVERWEAGRVPFRTKSINAVIRVPWRRAMVKATVPIVGAASARNFKRYGVDVSPGWPADDASPDAADFAGSSWTAIGGGLSEVKDSFVFPDGNETVYGNLASWETGLAPGEEYPEQDIFHPQTGDLYNGRWTVRLRVDTVDGSSRTVMVPVIVGRVVNNATGGLVRSDDGHARLTVPALASTRDWDVYAILSACPGDPDVPAPPPGYHQASAIYELLPPGAAFRRAATLDVDVSTGANPDAALYRYDPAAGRWLFVSSNRLALSTGTTVENANYLAADKPRSFFALFTRDDVPPPPVLRQPLTPTDRRIVTFTGTAEPNGDVALFEMVASTDAAQAVVRSDDTGLFVGALYLKPGVHSVSARQAGEGQSISGVMSDAAPAVSVTVSSRAAITVTSLRFFRTDFLAPKLDNFTAGATVAIELDGGDPDPSRRDVAYVTLAASTSDPTGLSVPLEETGPNTGIYRGSARLSNVTDAVALLLDAHVTGERLTATSEDDPSVSASLYLDNPSTPGVPVITASSHPFLFQDTFEDGIDGWATFDDGGGADLMISTPGATGLNALRLTQSKPNGDFGAVITNQSFNVRDNPFLSFDVRMTSNVRFNLFFRTSTGVLEYVLNDAGERPKIFPPSFDRLGSYLPDQRAGAIPADGQWHHFDINLFDAFRTKFPDGANADWNVQQVFLGDWDAEELFGIAPGNTPVGSWAEFDNVVLGNAGSADDAPEFHWTVPGATGGLTYAAVLDESSGTVPSDFATTGQGAARFPNESSGFHWFHVRARNANGVWGDANHYEILVDRVPPSISNPVPAPFSQSDVLSPTVQVVDPIGRGLDPDSVRFSVNGSSFDVTSQAVSYDAASGVLTLRLGAIRPTPPSFVDGQLITVSIDDAKDWAGNHIDHPFSWTWQADFSRFSGGDASPLTINGGRQPAWSPDGRSIVFVSDRGGQTDLWTMSAGDQAEKTGTPVALTHDAAAESWPAWSPNGRWIAYGSNAAGDDDIWILNVASGGATAVTHGAGADAHPAWSPDGRHLLFSRTVTGSADLYEVDVDPESGQTSNERQVTRDGVGYNLEPAWSRDGSTIFYRRSLYTDDIDRVNADGTNPAPLTAGRSDRRPAVRPDGREIVWSTARSAGVSALWTMDTDGQNQRRLLDNHDLWADDEPACSPDSGRLAFSSLRSGSWNVWTLSLLEVSDFAAVPSAFSPVSTAPNKEAGAVVHATTFTYRLSGAQATVDLTVESESGSTVRHLLTGAVESPGTYADAWDGNGDAGQPLPEGRYVGRLVVSGAGAPEPLVKQTSILIDRTPPTARLSPDRSAFKPSDDVGFAGEDPANFSSGLQGLRYAVDAGTAPVLSAFSAPFRLERGSHTVDFLAWDNAGNASDLQTRIITSDDGPPAIRFDVEGASAARDGRLFVSSSAVARLSAEDVLRFSSDVVTGISEIEATIDDQNRVYANADVLRAPLAAADGPHILRAQAYDGAGNGSGVSVSSFVVDSRAPSLAFAIVPAPFWDGVRDFAQAGSTLSFIVDDRDAAGETIGASGGAWVRLSTGGVVSLFAATDTVRLAGSGAISLIGAPIDAVGNIGATASETVVLTDRLPSAALSVTGGYAPPYLATGAVVTVVVATAAVVDRIEIDLDGAGFQTWTAGAPIPIDGTALHALAFRAVVGGVAESSESVTLQRDAAPPVTTLSFSTPTWTVADLTYVRPATVAVAASSDALSGVSQISYALGGSTRAYAGPFSVSSLGLPGEGFYGLAAWAVDRVGNAETPSPRRLAVDNTPPSSQLAIDGPRFDQNGSVFVSSRTLFSLTGADAGATASGLAGVWLSTGTGVYVESVSSFSLVDPGPRTIRYQAEDRVGNQESLHVFAVVVDTAAPTASLEPLGQSITTGTTLYLRSDAKVVVRALDNASGFSFSERSIDGSAFESAADAFALLPGSHTVTIRAVDQVQNESRTAFPVVVDDSAPVSTIVYVGAHLAESATDFIRPDTAIGFTATDDGSGPARVEYLVDDDALPRVFTSSFTLAPGLHSIRFHAVDPLLNAEAFQAAVVFVDGGAPTETVVFSPPPFFNGVAWYASTGTVATIAAADAPAGGAGLGEIDASVDEGSFTAVATSTGGETLSARWGIPDGNHSLRFHGVDLLGNAGAPDEFEFRSSTAAPSVSLAFVGPHAVVDGRHFGSADTAAVFSSSNPLTVRVVYKLRESGAPWPADYSVAAGSVAIGAGGSFDLLFAGETASGRESDETISIFIDSVAPSAVIGAVGGFEDVASSLTYLSAGGAATISAVDDGGRDNSGLSLARWRWNQGPWTIVASSVVAHANVALPDGPGVQTVTLDVVDAVGHETLVSRAFQRDADPPVTSLSASAAPVSVGDRLFYSGATAFSLTALDAISGVARIERSLDGAPFTVVTASFTVPASGDHVLHYRAADRAGNQESDRTFSFSIDADPPVVALTVQGSSATDGGRLVVSAAATVRLDAADAGVGLRSISYSIDGGPPLAYDSQPFSLSTGPRTVAYWASDRLNTASVPGQFSAVVDGTPPVSTWNVEGASATDSTGLRIATSTVLVARSSDVVCERVETLISVDGAALPGVVRWQGTPGAHSVIAIGRDCVGNEEAPRPLSVFVDNVPPGIPTGFASTATSDHLYLSWSASPETDLGGYELADNTGFVARFAPTETVASVSLPQNVRRHYELRAVDTVGNRSDPAILDLVFGVPDDVPPAAVTDLAATLVSSTSVTLSWTSTGDDGLLGETTGQYELSLSTDSAFSADATRVFTAVLIVAPGKPMTASVDGLSAGTTYYAAVRLGDEVPNWSGKSNVASFATPPSIVADRTPPVTTLSLASSTGPVILSAVDTGTDGGPASGVASTWYVVDGGTETRFTAPFDLPSGPHDVRYWSLDVAGNAEAPRTSHLNIPDVTPPAPVTDLAATAVSSASVTLSWTATGDDGLLGETTGQYRLTVSTDSSFPQTVSRVVTAVLALVPGETVTASVDGLSAGTTYFAAVRLADEVPNWSGDSNVDSFVTPASIPADRTPPVTVLSLESSTGPVILSAVDTGTDGGPASGVASTWYELDGGTATLFATAFDLSSGPHDVKYWSVDKAGNAETPQTSHFDIPDVTPPSAVTDLVGVAVSSASVTLSWTSTGDDGRLGETRGRYRITVATTSSFNPIVFSTESDIELIPGTTAAVVIGGLSASTTYFATIALADEAQNWSSVSNVASFLTTDDPDRDLAPPITTLSLETPAGPVVLTAVDQGSGHGTPSGVASTWYGVNGSTDTLYAAPFSLRGGTYTVRYHSVDRAGNRETDQISDIVIADTVPPAAVTDFSVIRVATDAVTLSLTLTGDDGKIGETSGFLGIAVSTDSSVRLSTESLSLLQPVFLSSGHSDSGTVSSLAPGSTYTAVCFLRDDAGNWSGRSNAVSFVTLPLVSTATDTLPPTTTLSFDGHHVPAFDREFISPRTRIVLKAVDGGTPASGVARTEWRDDPGAVRLYTGPFSLSAGSHTVVYRSVDRAGNEEEEHRQPLVVGPWIDTGLYADQTAQVVGRIGISGDVMSDGRAAVSGRGTIGGDVIAPSVQVRGRIEVEGHVEERHPALGDFDLDALAAQLAHHNDNDRLPKKTDRGRPLFRGGVLTLDDDGVSIASGTYFVEAMRFSGDVSLRIAGPVRVLVTGPVTSVGQLRVNAGGTPDDALIILTGRDDVRFVSARGTTVAAFVYGPDRDMAVVGSTRWSGSLLGRDVVAAGRVQIDGGSGSPAAPALVDDPSGDGLDPSFKLGEVYAFPNPARDGRTPTIHIESGYADRVRADIFDLAGEPLDRLETGGLPAVIDGDSGPVFAYEMPWRRSVPSGVYLYLITAERDGQNPLHKSGKFSIVR